MKLVTYDGGRDVVGVITPDMLGVIDLSAAVAALKLKLVSPMFESMLTLIEAGEEGLARCRQILDHYAAGDLDTMVRPLAQTRLLAPLQPPRVLCFSVYEAHVRQAFEAGIELRAGKAVGALARRMGLVRLPRSFYQRPVFYKGSQLSISGPNDDILWPRWCELLDYEIELGVVIGKAGKNIDANDAMSHVFGYTCFNDFSARDVMMKELMGGLGPIKAKDFDTGNAIGPWIVTADEIPDPYNLRMQVRVNGELRGDTSTSFMTHPIQAMLVAASDEERVVPGQFIGTGAAKDGCGMETLRFLEPGDVVEIEIERIGILRNRVVKPT